MRRLTVCCILGLAGLLGEAAEADETPASRWSKDIRMPELEGEELITVPLDADVYSAAAEDWADVRIRNSRGSEVPYLFEKKTKKQKRTRRKTWKAEDVSVKPLEEGELQIRLTLEEDAPQPDGFTVVTPLKNFEQRVQVFASDGGDDGEDGDDGDDGRPLVADAVIFDYSQYMDVSRRELPLPETSAREFRIVIGSLTADQESPLMELTRRLRDGEQTEQVERTTIQRRPFHIDRIEFWNETSYISPAEIVTKEWPVADMAVSEDAEEQQTVIEVRTRREPLTKFVLQMPGRNFSRTALVKVPETTGTGVRTTWREVGRSRISRFEFRDLDQEDLEIAFPEQRHEQYRIRIDNHDSPPLQIDGVEAIGPIYQLVYLASRDESYSLRYGSEDPAEWEVPEYDVAAIQAALQEGIRPVEAELGDAVAVSEGDRVDVPDVINNPIVLGVAICLLVAVLAWALVHAGRRVDQMPP